MRLDEDSYVIAVWMVPANGDDERPFDWMCTIWRKKKEDKEIQGEYRFRYHDSEHEDPWLSGPEDERSVYVFATTEHEKKAVENLHKLAGLVSMKNRTTVDFTRIDGGMDRYLEIMKAKPWCSIKEVTQQ